MTIRELRDQLDEVNAAMETIAPDTVEYYELRILRSQLKKEIVAGAFDIDKDISAITVADVSKLKELTAELKKATTHEEQKVAIAKRIISIAKVALNSAGVPI